MDRNYSKINQHSKSWNIWQGQRCCLHLATTMLSSFCKWSGLIFMKYKHRCIPSCIAKSMPFVTRWEPTLLTSGKHLYSAEPKLNLPSQQSLLADTQDLPIHNGLQAQDGLYPYGSQLRINFLSTQKYLNIVQVFVIQAITTILVHQGFSRLIKCI